MNSSENNILQSIKRPQDVGIYDRIAQAYAWHMKEDPVYSVDRNYCLTDEKRQEKIRSALKKLKQGGAHLRANDPIEYEFLTSLIDLGQQKAIEHWESGLRYIGFDFEQIKLGVLKKSDSKIPLKAGLIIHALLSAYRNDKEKLDELRMNLDPVNMHPSLRNGSLREAIIFNNYCSWEFDDSYLPYPSDDPSCGAKGWAHRYSQVLERSLFKGLGARKTKLIEIGYKMTFDHQDDFCRLLNLGARRELGLTPIDFIGLCEGTIKDKPLMLFLGLVKDLPRSL